MSQLSRYFAALLVAIVLVACGGNKSKKADTKLNDPPSDSEANVALPPEGPPVVRQTATEPSEPAADAAEGDGQVSRADLDGFLDRGPSYVLTIVTVEPIHADSGFVGYQITEVTQGARAFMTPQLRVGDVVTHINGVRLKRPEDYMQAWRSLDKVGTIRVDFTRKQEAMHAAWTVK